MKTKACLTILAILAAALPAWAGALAPVACDADMALSSRPTYIMAFKIDSGAPGLVSKQAMVGTARGSGWSCAVAIDASTADAKAPDILRLDFSGKGEFTSAPTAKLTAGESPAAGVYMASFGPVEVKAAANGTTVPVRVRGTYIKQGNMRRLEMTLGTGVEGKCSFGGKELPIRIIDGDNDLHAGKAWQKRSLGKNVAVMPGDTVVVDVGDGTFAGGVRKACYGSPIEVGGKWYEVTASADGKQATARAVDVAGGKLHVGNARWTAMLIGEKYVLALDGGPDAVAVPAGEYDLRSYQEFSHPDATGKQAQLDVAIAPGPTSKVTVEAGKTTEWAIGSPLKGSVRAMKQGDNVVLSLVLTDAGGRPVTGLTTIGGAMPAAPTVIVKDASGKVVYQNTLEYG